MIAIYIFSVFTILSEDLIAMLAVSYFAILA